MTHSKTIYQVDAFTDEPFKGNPAGVMIVDEAFEAERMQNIALEMNLSETAFIIPGNDHFQIRYFTPVKEVPLCGHATLASAHIIYELGLKGKHDPIRLIAKGADLTITKEYDWVMMNFPKYPVNRMDTPVGVKDCVGFEPVEVYASLYDWIIVVAPTEQDIQASRPNFELLTKYGLGHLMITAKSDQEEIDYVVRCFSPVSGINEDPVTGSAHCALAPLWGAKLKQDEMNSFQLSKRTGKLKVKLKDDQVEIKGKAITVFEARLRI